jgi:predicted GNAT family N-acyltransferase
VTLLGRLARDQRNTGERLGERLLLDAFIRSYIASFTVGSVAIIADPIHEQAKKFYLAYGFIELINSPKMFISMKTVAQLF